MCDNNIPSIAAANIPAVVSRETSAGEISAWLCQQLVIPSANLLCGSFYVLAV